MFRIPRAANKTLNSPDILSLLLYTTGCLAFPLQAVAQDVSGESLNGTVTLESGFLPDPYVIEITPGGTQAVEDLGAGCNGYIFGPNPDLKLQFSGSGSQLGIYVTADIDTTLVINDPQGNWHCNDDSAYLDNSNPGILFENPSDGLYDIWVGTYADIGANSTGNLVISELSTDLWGQPGTGGNSTGTFISDGGIDFGDDLSTWSNNEVCDDPRFTGSGMTAYLLDSDLYHDATDCYNAFNAGTVTLIDSAPAVAGNLGNETLRGRLETGDPVLPGNGHVDRYAFQGITGNNAVINLRSADFDTYLRVTSPGGEVFVNDDYEGSYSQSLLNLVLTESGQYTVEVTSYGSDVTGAYTLEMRSNVGSATVNLDYSGTLAANDEVFSTGEYFDTYTFEGSPGQTVVLDLASDDFDTYLVLEAPDGEREVNDDSDSAYHSQITRQLSALGTYTVRVTSYSAGETGSYTLAINQAGSGAGIQSRRDSATLAFGESANGSLQADDNLNDNNKYEDIFAFEGVPGQAATITLDSTSFDTYLTVITPSGTTVENDDFEGSIYSSRIDLNMTEGGRYRIVASSYDSNATGNYILSLARSNGVTAPLFTDTGNPNGNVYGIFMGIADYPGTENDLDLTDQDALRARDALVTGAHMNPDSAWTLLNADATRANFSNVLGTIGARSTPNDTLVIFFSGHGTQELRPGGPNNTDPDGMDESIVLYDSLLLDDELDIMLDDLNIGRILLVFDSCYSGGFAKDVVSAPGRMGFFSSEEDVTSQVAYKFQAGGFLSVFFDDAIRGGYADGDMNSELTAYELSEYLHERYRYDVKAYGDEAASIRIAGPQASYQHLVVDRGGINAQSVLFYR
jgi:hypothetical protein